MTYGLVPVEETMGELLKMKQEGKIRAIGDSNVNLPVMKDYVAAGQLDVIQEKLSILDRKPETELLPFCEEHGITLQTYSPIEQGLLAGKASNDYVPQKGEEMCIRDRLSTLPPCCPSLAVTRCRLMRHPKAAWPS